jgi:hypothetical protein
MYSHQAEALLARIRSEIGRYGQSVVGCDRLLVLVPDTDPIGAQFGHIFAIAEQERWSFEFRNDGTVRFANLSATVAPIIQWPAPEPDAVQINARSW